jgi:uncharacterized protein YqgC (DUF456 family)
MPMLLVPFVIAMIIAVVLVPLGIPGTFLMVAIALAADYFASAGIGWIAIGVSLVLAIIAEVLEWTLSASFAKKYGGSPRAGWGALFGGFAGALVGVPVPVIGSVIGAFVGAFLGALVAEYSRTGSTSASATRVATGALLGRAAATAIKLAIAITIAVLLTFALIRA